MVRRRTLGVALQTCSYKLLERRSCLKVSQSSIVFICDPKLAFFFGSRIMEATLGATWSAMTNPSSLFTSDADEVPEGAFTAPGFIRASEVFYISICFFVALFFCSIIL